MGSIKFGKNPGSKESVVYTESVVEVVKPVYSVVEKPHHVEKPVIKVKEVHEVVKKPAFVVEEVVEVIKKPKFSVESDLNHAEDYVAHLENVQNTLKLHKKLIISGFAVVTVLQILSFFI